MLQSLGLTDTESDIYLHLLQSGQLTAKDIGDELSVPISNIYAFLNTLESKGIVLKVGSHPANYVPVDPRKALQKLLALRESEVEVLKQQALEIEKKLYKVSQLRSLDREFLQIITGEDPNVRRQHFQTLETAAKSVKIALQLQERHLEEDGKKLRMFFDAIYVDDVKFLFGVGTLGDKFQQFIESVPEITNRIKFHTIPTVNPLYFIIDAERVLVKLPDPVTGFYDFTSVIIWDEEFVHLFLEKFDVLWNTSTPVVV